VLHIHVHVDQGGLVSYLFSNLQVVVKVLHIHVHVDQGGLVSYLISNLQVVVNTHN
jgi:NAD(P)H-flavin reductase